MSQPPDPHTLPATDEVEVSLFGPGVGECVVLHLGGGRWAIVDSCVDRNTLRPAALDYLAEIGVDVGEAVKLVVVSHWHDDHIQGAAAVLRNATSAVFSCSAALTSGEFLEMVAGARSTLMESPGVGELRDILEILAERAPRRTRPESVAPVLAKQGTVVFRQAALAATPAAEIHALSPADGAFTLSWHEIAQSFPALGQPKRRAVALSPNQVAVVLWVRIGETTLLLGSDLEESSHETLGWRAIVRSPIRPHNEACLFKVPHHGSVTADNADVWSQMLAPQPHALVTSFSRGGISLPTRDDLARLRSRTPHLYCTSRPGGSAPQRRASAVEKMANQVARNRRTIRGEMGHVRVRTRASGSPLEVHCCRGAYRAS